MQSATIVTTDEPCPRAVPVAVSEQLLERDGGARNEVPGAIRLGELYRSPSVARIFPEADRLMAEARAWLLQYIAPLGCGQRLLRPVDETVTMCPYLFPESDYEGNFLATVFTTLQFVNDDIFDSVDVYEAFLHAPTGGRLAQELRHIRANPKILGHAMMAMVRLLKEGGTGPESIELPDGISGALFMYDAIRDFARRLHAFGSGTQSPSFHTWLGTFLDALMHFSRSHMDIYKAVESMSIEEYAAHKLINCGMTHTVLLLELATGCFLSAEQSRLPLIAEIKEHCIYVGSLLNEITSYEKEVFYERSGNLLLVVKLKQQCSLHEATRYVAALAQTHADEVERLRDRAQIEFAGDDPTNRMLRRYVRGIDLLTAACWDWQIVGTTRYRSPKSPFAELLVRPA